ncbi:MAG: glutamate synthase-related protein [Bacteroidota bacterium]
MTKSIRREVFNPSVEHSSCGVGFITRKDGQQTHEVLTLADQSLCKIPHRGGISAEGIGDGAGVNIDISEYFFQKLLGDKSLKGGEFGVGNFFYPYSEAFHQKADDVIEETLKANGFKKLLRRKIEVNKEVLNEAAQKAQLPIIQFVFSKPKQLQDRKLFEKAIYVALLKIEEAAFSDGELRGFYPLSMSCYTQVYKGRLVSSEVFPYFVDLSNPDHKINSLFFHTRFSTNTAPNPIFAQPFRKMAHNGEINTDKKNRLSEDAKARAKGKSIYFPAGQSDSSRLDQTLTRRVMEDDVPIDEAILALMPPAWENDETYDGKIRDMLSYFSLTEEKNDGPAAVIFFDGIKIGAHLDRLGLRPLRTVETVEYLAVMSEAGQIDFDPKTIVSRGKVEAGGIFMYNHEDKTISKTRAVLENLAGKKDYKSLLEKSVLQLNELPNKSLKDYHIPQHLSDAARHVAYGLNKESFKFFLDPMLELGKEKISAMGFGVAPNVLEPNEGGMSRYFSQRFAQVTNPPLDSIREADGMTIKVSLGRNPHFQKNSGKQLVIESPVLQPNQLLQIEAAETLEIKKIDATYNVDTENRENNKTQLKSAVHKICDLVESFVNEGAEIIILSDVQVSEKSGAIPIILLVSAVNQRLISTGKRFHASIIVETGQAVSTHDTACILGFGASAVCPITVFTRAKELYPVEEIPKRLQSYQSAIEKAIMKTLGKFGICTVESYIGGEFFESNFLDTEDEYLKQIFPNINSPIGGASFADLANNSAEWHQKIFKVKSENEIPLLGLFKERTDGAGHSYGSTAVREYVKMTEENFTYTDYPVPNEQPHQTELVPNDPSYKLLGFDKRTPEQLSNHKITPAYRNFVKEVYRERELRPAAIRDVLHLPFNAHNATTVKDYEDIIDRFCTIGNVSICVQGISISQKDSVFTLHITSRTCKLFAEALVNKFGDEIELITIKGKLEFVAKGNAYNFCSLLQQGKDPIQLEEVTQAHNITSTFSSGAMSHGALVAKAHQAVAQGANIAGALSNSGEGGEQRFRYNSIKASKIKQFASGRFGVWAGYVADPSLEEIEIKIAQGAKPGEGGQLPAKKVNVEIAAARSGTPGVELVSPPPHHDTYSIEDLAQLIHDAKCARVRVIVKLVSSEGVGTIAVGVAKAGADVINIAGNTGGTGAAQVTSLKNSGRIAEIGIAEVHQALSANGLRDKVILRCSNAHQTGLDVIKSAILGGDSFEFGTSALMMLKCVMAKNCNVKCPAGLTTNEEMYEGDPRALAQYFINLAHEVRELLARLGYKSLKDIRGKTNLLNLIRHETMIGQLDMSGMLVEAEEIKVENPVYLEANFDPDDHYIIDFERDFIQQALPTISIDGPELKNLNKTTGGQFSVDVERYLNYQVDPFLAANHPSILELKSGRRIMAQDSVTIRTTKSAGQSFGAFNNSGVTLIHEGLCNDGVGKALTGGCIVIKNPGFADEVSSDFENPNNLIGNFALFGAMGGELYVNGQAGDRFGVRNSGAVAVVEGVGDFCCEYMTNGTIVNLGHYGKGFGNGMSGGTAYQYDPAHKIHTRSSKDSIEIIPLSTQDQLSEGNEEALLNHLHQHYVRTSSPLVKQLLDNWEEERQHFYYMIPKSLINYHRGENILKLLSRKEMIEELAVATAKNNVQFISNAYLNEYHLFNGLTPDYSENSEGGNLVPQYIVVAGLWRRALEAAGKISKYDVDRNAKKLIITQDRKFMDILFKDMKDAFISYSDDALAHLLADKRVRDYKEASSKREVADTNALGSTVWIIECDKVNALHLKNYQSMTKQLATHYLNVLAHAVAEVA